MVKKDIQHLCYPPQKWSTNNDHPKSNTYASLGDPKKLQGDVKETKDAVANMFHHWLSTVIVCFFLFLSPSKKNIVARVQFAQGL